ncbi:hypothetical protein BN946_scf184845.g36 [Trametes cinnabarina]|uniref:NADP-dependent oxidoreductase domain-containing protein n=1 Tax=Pycnoporus cinnabarinus TaxID=5643 RepID=A0A060SA94_PYCCI|nr:hypothetical protein BN946_scf184845.g36 [Trametes cinnabarina]
MVLPTRKISQSDVTAIGYGAMGIAAYYGSPLPDEQRLKAEEKREEKDIFLATKFGFALGVPNRVVCGDTEYVPKALVKSLDRLESVWICRSLVPPPVSISLTARELGVKIVAYSPVGRGLLTGKITSPDDLPENDGRRTPPRFSKENFPKVLQVVDIITKFASKYDATPAQVSLAWLLAQGDDIIPIPGTTKNLTENLGALNVRLAPQDLEEIRKIAIVADRTVGPRYHESGMKLLFVATPPLE